MFYEGLIFALLYLIAGIYMLIYALTSDCVNKKPLMCLGALFLSLTLFIIYACAINSTGLAAAGVCIPIGLLMLWVSLNPIFLFKKCTFPVTAKLIDIEYEHRGKSGGWLPKFKYKYRGEEIISKPFVVYSKRRLDRLYPENKKRGYSFIKPEYNIFIDPNVPTRCVDKRDFSFCRHIVLAVFSLLLIVLGICFPFII